MDWNLLVFLADSYTLQQPQPLSTHPRPVGDPSGNLRTVKDCGEKCRATEALQGYTFLSFLSQAYSIYLHQMSLIFHDPSIDSHKASSCQFEKQALQKRMKKHNLFSRPETKPTIQNHLDWRVMFRSS